MKAARKVACPSCGKLAEYSLGNEWRPFCSERCRTVDLGAWASESYRIPQRPGERDPEDPAADPEWPGEGAAQ